MSAVVEVPAVAVALGAESPVFRLIRAALPHGERLRALDEDSCLGDLGIGSLRMLHVIMGLEDECGLAPEALSEISTRSTLGALVRLCAPDAGAAGLR